MRRRLFWAIFGVAAGVLVVVLVMVVGGMNTLRERATRAELERAAEVIAEVVGERIEARDDIGGLLRGEPTPAVEAELGVIRRAAGGSDVALFAVTADGRVVGRPMVRGLAIDAQAIWEGRGTFKTVASGEGEVLVHARPIAQLPARDVTLGVVLARRAPVDLRLPWVVVAVAVALVAVVALGAAGLISGSISRRVGSVAAAASSLAGGDLSARADVEGEDELAMLGDTFNQMADRLEQSRERERQFLLAVGHDLRTPLTTITGYAEALADRKDDPEEIARVAEVLETEGRRLRRLIEDVMLLARLEASEYTMRPEPVDVRAHIDGTLGPFRDQSAGAGVEMAEALDHVGVRVVDPDRLAQILGNLVENALRYTPEAGKVGVRLTADGDRLVLEVSDTGAGIEPEDLPHIFERFYVARRYRGIRPEGSGLGLSIVRRLAEAMGGALEADSVPGEGTRIRVVVPAPPA